MNLGHKKLEVWQRSIKLVKLVYETTSAFPPSELYGLTSQARRAAVSVASNIAEGASRSGARERARFYEMGRSSLAELDTHVEIALELEFVDSSQFERLSDEMTSVFAMLSRLITSTRS